jgi:hypothetical protein
MTCGGEQGPIEMVSKESSSVMLGLELRLVQSEGRTRVLQVFPKSKSVATEGFKHDLRQVLAHQSHDAILRIRSVKPFREQNTWFKQVKQPIQSLQQTSVYY